MDILPAPLIEKEAFRLLFAQGGGLDELEGAGAPGVAAAKVIAANYVAAVVDLVEGRAADAPAAGEAWDRFAGPPGGAQAPSAGRPLES